jgi:hypothetical protein
MQCQSLTLHVVGKFCRGGKAMNEPSANSFFVILLFILRCLVPLSILFGISYLLRKMGLVSIEEPEPPDDLDDDNEAGAENTSDVAASLEESTGKGLKPLAVNPNETATVENTKETQQ